MSKLQMRKSRFAGIKFLSLAILAAFFLGGHINFGKFWPISHKPASPEIEQLTLATAMTPKAQQLFYKNDPKIEPKNRFHSLCKKPGRDPQKTIHLGCFIINGNETRIVIQSITDSRLPGLMEVAAAHEMLHAAYQELSAAERSRLSPKLKQAAQRVKLSHLVPILKEYEAGDPEIYLNELHSYLGTELADLGDPDLEKYYQNYFQDRQQVLALAQRSSSMLSQLEEKAKGLKAEIESLEAQLKGQKESIEQADQNLAASLQNLEQMKLDLSSFKQRVESSPSQIDASLISQFEREADRLNAEVQQHNAQSQALQETVSQFNQEVATYKQKVASYNELVETNRSILSSLIIEEPEVIKPSLP
jgi:predicted  nucleic acid-binding Zn-ribbon protein